MQLRLVDSDLRVDDRSCGCHGLSVPSAGRQHDARTGRESRAADHPPADDLAAAERIRTRTNRRSPVRPSTSSGMTDASPGGTGDARRTWTAVNPRATPRSRARQTGCNFGRTLSITDGRTTGAQPCGHPCGARPGLPALLWLDPHALSPDEFLARE